ncbi:MAG: trypsin-like serine protease, partial [Acetobacteraceae bacterium]|nr:trypsin-like serine protease [Acetobacteraceae bacterium]
GGRPAAPWSRRWPGGPRPPPYPPPLRDNWGRRWPRWGTGGAWPYGVWWPGWGYNGPFWFPPDPGAGLGPPDERWGDPWAGDPGGAASPAAGPPLWSDAPLEADELDLWAPRAEADRADSSAPDAAASEDFGAEEDLGDALPFEADFGQGEDEEADLSVVGPVDDRVQEIQTTRFPWNTMVNLCRDFGDGQCAGCSGALVGPRRVLTAAHCLWSLKRRAAPRRILVAAGRSDRDTMPYGTVEARRYWVPRGFVDGPNRGEWDWGVIELPRPFPRIRRFPPVRPLPDAALARLAAQGRITVAGYPSDRPIGTLWRHAERLVRFGRRRLFHTVDTCPGHSGSPILARLGGTAAVIGVHTAGLLDAEGRSHGCNRGAVLAPPGSVNSGVRATPAMLEALARPAASRTGPASMVPLP